MSTATVPGMYGLSIDGIADGALLAEVPATWPRVRVDAHVGAAPQTGPFIDHDAAVMIGAQCASVVSRDPATVTLTLRSPVPSGSLVHPFLAVPCAIHAYWRGDTALHAGAIVGGRGAVAVLGTRGSGKTTTLALAHLAGYCVLTDDLLVLRGATAFAGPRCLDLREETATALSLGDALGVVGTRARWRAVLPPAPAEVPLAGIVLPQWGDAVRVQAVPAARRIPLLLEHLGIRAAAPPPAALLELVAVPFWCVERPRDWAVCDAYLDAVSQLVGPP